VGIFEVEANFNSTRSARSLKSISLLLAPRSRKLWQSTTLEEIGGTRGYLLGRFVVVLNLPTTWSRSVITYTPKYEAASVGFGLRSVEIPFSAQTPFLIPHFLEGGADAIPSRTPCKNSSMTIMIEVSAEVEFI